MPMPRDVSALPPGDASSIHSGPRDLAPPRRWMIITAALLALLPVGVLVLRGVPLGNLNSGYDADFALHMQRLFAQELLSHHQFPVRWLRGGNDGFGSPAFYFYPQLGYLISTLTQALLGLRPERALVITMALARAVAFVGAYAWLRLRSGNMTLAALGAALFLLSPYIATNIDFQRFAFAEGVSIALIPLVLLQIDAPWRSGPRFLVGAAVFALLGVTHLPEAVLLGLIAVGYALACHGVRRAVEVATAGALGLIMGALWLMPAFLLRDWTNSSGWTAGYFSPAYHLFFSPKLTEMLRHIPVYVTYATIFAAWLLAVAGAVLLAWAGRGIRVRATRAERGLLLVLVIVLLAMTWPAALLWEATPVLRDVQFPWRLLAVAPLLAAAATVIAVRARPRLIPWLAAVVVALSLGQTAFPLVDLAVSPSQWHAIGYRLPNFASSFTGRMTIAEQSFDGDTPEYVPQLAYAAGWRAWDRARHEMPGQSTHAALRAPAILAGEARIERTTPADVAPRTLLQFDADIRGPSGAVVRLPVLSWPALRLVGGGTLTTDPATGLVLAHLPPGKRTVLLTLGMTRPERLGAVLSTLGFLLWLLGCAWVAFSGAALRQRVVSHTPG